ncbi:MAG: hypothetical protein ABIR27_06205 [Dokdonella sp.]
MAAAFGAVVEFAGGADGDGDLAIFLGGAIDDDLCEEARDDDVDAGGESLRATLDPPNRIT